MSDDPATDAEFVKPMLLPFSMIYSCPTCGASAEPVELAEDEAGTFSVPVDQRFLKCECGTLLDIGWAGWRYHDGDPR